MRWRWACILVFLITCAGRAQQIPPRADATSKRGQDNAQAAPGSAIGVPESALPLTPKQKSAREAQISAAMNDAYDSLRQQVLATPMVRGITVATFVRAAHSEDQLDEAIHSAEQVGGARWLEDQTVQVRLELPGSKLVTALLAMQVLHPKVLPMSYATLKNHLNNTVWRQTFSATGSSTAGSAASRLRPDPSQVTWKKVSDAARRAAIDAARKNAVDRVVDSLKPIDLGRGHRLSEALGVPTVNAPLRDWLSSRPVRSIQFMDDLEIRLTLSATPRELWPTLKTGLEMQRVVRIPENPAGWDHLWKQVDARMAIPVGTALAQAPAPATAPAVVIPAEPPAWIDGPADAEAESGPVGKSKLKTARVAEALALERLRAKLGALPLTPGMTLSQAARKDARLNAALTRALTRARIAKVEYDSPRPGWVKVKMTLDLQDLWTAISGQ